MTGHRDSAPNPEAGPATDAPWAAHDEQDVRPYAVTRGRTRPRHTMRMLSLLRATNTGPEEGLAPEAARAVELCREQECSVAEIAAVIGLPVQVTKIVISDLIDCGALIMALPRTGADQSQLLEALLSGLHTRFCDVA